MKSCFSILGFSSDNTLQNDPFWGKSLPVRNVLDSQYQAHSWQWVLVLVPGLWLITYFIYYYYTRDSCLGLTIYFISNSNWVKADIILGARNRTQDSPPRGLLYSLGYRSCSHMLSLCPCLILSTTMRSKVSGGSWGCSVGHSGSGTLMRGVDLNSFGLRRALNSDLFPELQLLSCDTKQGGSTSAGHISKDWNVLVACTHRDGLAPVPRFRVNPRHACGHTQDYK